MASLAVLRGFHRAAHLMSYLNDILPHHFGITDAAIVTMAFFAPTARGPRRVQHQHADNNSTAPHLLNLPQELRDEIYAHLPK